MSAHSGNPAQRRATAITAWLAWVSPDRYCRGFSLLAYPAEPSLVVEPTSGTAADVDLIKHPPMRRWKSPLLPRKGRVQAARSTYIIRSATATDTHSSLKQGDQNTLDGRRKRGIATVFSFSFSPVDGGSDRPFPNHQYACKLEAPNKMASSTAPISLMLSVTGRFTCLFHVNQAHGCLHTRLGNLLVGTL